MTTLTERARGDPPAGQAIRSAETHQIPTPTLFMSYVSGSLTGGAGAGRAHRSCAQEVGDETLGTQGGRLQGPDQGAPRHHYRGSAKGRVAGRLRVSGVGIGLDHEPELSPRNGPRCDFWLLDLHSLLQKTRGRSGPRTAGLNERQRTRTGFEHRPRCGSPIARSSSMRFSRLVILLLHRESRARPVSNRPDKGANAAVSGTSTQPSWQETTRNDLVGTPAGKKTRFVVAAGLPPRLRIATSSSGQNRDRLRLTVLGRLNTRVCPKLTCHGRPPKTARPIPRSW